MHRYCWHLVALILISLSIASSQSGVDVGRVARFEARRDSIHRLSLRRQHIDSTKWAQLRQVDTYLDSSYSNDLKSLVVGAEVVGKGRVISNPVVLTFPVETNSGQPIMWNTGAVKVHIDKVFKCQPVDFDEPPSVHAGDAIRVLDYEHTSGINVRRPKSGSDMMLYAGDTVYVFLTRRQLQYKNPTRDDYRAEDLIPVTGGRVAYFRTNKHWLTTTTIELERDIESVSNLIEGGSHEN